MIRLSLLDKKHLISGEDNNMRHYLKYYKELESKGHLWRVEIHQESNVSFAPIEIGPVLQGLKLVIQGDQANVDTPIVKTSMEMTFVDAPDLEELRKCGYWEEFYTSSSTEYMVILFKDGVKEWSGFITPDSFSETLQYRGSVTIIARDNLGTLQDIDFDMSALANIDGKVRISELINLALGKSSCPLELRYDSSAFPSASDILDSYVSDGNELLEQYVDTINLNDGSWYDALYNVLESIGVVLRYVGNNTLLLMPLRDIPKFGQKYWADIERREVKFRSYGNRELLPGIKSIQEIDYFDVDTEERNEIIPMYDGNTAMINCDHIILTGPTSTLTSPFETRVSGYHAPSKQLFIAPEYSSILNVSEYPRVEGEDSEEYGQWDDKSIIYFAVNATTTDNSLKFARGIHTTGGKVSIRFTADKPVSLLSDFSAVLNTPIARASSYGTDPFLRYRLVYNSASRTLYYDSSTSAWKTAKITNAATLSSGLFSADHPLPKKIELADISVPGIGEVIFEIIDIQITILDITLRKDCIGMYLRLKDIGIDVELPEDFELPEKLTINTEYSDRYSVKLTKQPAFAIVPTSLPEVSYVPSAIVSKCIGQYRSAQSWSWKNEAGILLQRLIHQQLLAYHARPNNILTGELVTENPIFNAIYDWGGREHILVSGKLDIITGRMQNVTLREFYRYDRMWEIWSEQDAVEVSSLLTQISLRIHTNRIIRRTEVMLPQWVRFVSMTVPVDGVVTLTLEIMPNLTEAERVAYLSISTAIVKIIQNS